MPKRNYRQLEKRQTKLTVLLYCEGRSDEAFCKHLKYLFNSNSTKAVKIKKGRGGSPVDIVKGALKILGDYHIRAVLFDSDKTLQEIDRARKTAQKKKITVIENVPCLEMLLLQILGIDKKKLKMDSKFLKKYFEDNYIPTNKRSDQKKYQDLFPKSLIESKINSIGVLKKIVDLIAD